MGKFKKLMEVSSNVGGYSADEGVYWVSSEVIRRECWVEAGK